MSVYRRGKTCWYKFYFNGQLIRESAKTNSKTVAREAEKARHRELEEAYNRIPKRRRTPLFAAGAKAWLAGKKGLAPRSPKRDEQCVENLRRGFGDRLRCGNWAGGGLRFQPKRICPPGSEPPPQF